MAAKTTATDSERKDGKLLAFPMLASVKIYKGSTVVADATARFAQTNDGATITLAAGDKFLGICAETMDNVGADGDEDVRVYRNGVHLLEFTDALTVADLGKPVLLNNVTDNGAVTVTSDSGNPEVQVGEIVEIVSASTARVDIANAVGNLVADAA